MSQMSDLREACLARDNYQCQAEHIAPHIKCGAGLHADHIKNRSTHPHLKYELSNMQSLCWKCHTVKTSGEVWASKVLGLYGREWIDWLDPSYEDLADAKEQFTKAKERL